MRNSLDYAGLAQLCARSPIMRKIMRAHNRIIQPSLVYSAYKAVWCTQCRMTHTHTHPFNGPFSGTTHVSQYQKGKTNLDFTEARDNEWQWQQLGHMQVCTLLQREPCQHPTTRSGYKKTVRHIVLVHTVVSCSVKRVLLLNDACLLTFWPGSICSETS